MHSFINSLCRNWNHLTINCGVSRQRQHVNKQKSIFAFLTLAFRAVRNKPLYQRAGHIEAYVRARTREGQVYVVVAAVFQFNGSKEPSINPTWLKELMAVANSPGGLHIIPEPELEPAAR